MPAAAPRDATYDAVSTEATGHAEAVKISYDPTQISYAQLLQIFFTVAHDPTQVNRQGPDSGPSYRSAIFPQNAAPGAAAQGVHRAAQRRHAYKAPIATQIEHGGFYPAEAYHQDFARKHPYYPVHRRQRPSEGGRAAAALSRSLQGVSAAKRLKFHALFSLGATKAAAPHYMRATGRRWRLGTTDHADDQSLR